MKGNLTIFEKINVKAFLQHVAVNFAHYPLNRITATRVGSEYIVSLPGIFANPINISDCGFDNSPHFN